MNSSRLRLPRSLVTTQVGVAALTAVLMLCLSPSAHAQWKWRDSNNRVQYSDLPPPPSVPEASILQRPSNYVRPVGINASAGATKPAEAASSAPKVDNELEARKKKAEAEKAAAEAAQNEKAAAGRKENCERARNHLKAVEEGQRMFRTNAKGEREVFDDKIRAEESRRTRELITSECQ